MGNILERSVADLIRGMVSSPLLHERSKERARKNIFNEPRVGYHPDMRAAAILIIDDDPSIRTSLRLGLKHEGYDVLEADSGEAARAAMGQAVDLVLLDYQLPDTDGLALLAWLRQEFPDAVVIMLTAHASVDLAVEAMQHGAFHYAAKPVDLDHLSVLVDRGLQTTRLLREVRRLRADRGRPYALDSFIGESPPARQLKVLLGKTARSPTSTVLLVGESGTGKGLAANVIHHNSDRADGPFMEITCSAMPGALLESELFGHERGAFTDAKQQKRGLLELAHGGTVFLDEFTEMEPALQAKLLRFLEDKAFRRVGGAKDIRVDVRVIAATNRRPEEAVREGLLRKDLYYRLQVLTITLPPLRQRAEDIVPLAKFFVDQFNRDFGKQVQQLVPAAQRLLEHHPWEGNVRELRNAVERAMLFSEGPALASEDFAMLAQQQPLTEGFQLPPAGVVLEELERSLVVQALARCDDNRTRAAGLLGMSRDQIRYRIEKFGLE